MVYAVGAVSGSVSFITVQYELLLAVSLVVLCIGSKICYWAICALSGSVNYYCAICAVFSSVIFTECELYLTVSFVTVQYVLFSGSVICYCAICALSGSVNYYCAISAVFSCVICYCAICVVLVVSFVTVQCGVCHAVSVCNECELCLTVICYVLFLAVSFITVQYTRVFFWRCELLLCNMSYFRQHHLCYYAIWAMPGSVIITVQYGCRVAG